jgi:hypothetical protein
METARPVGANNTAALTNGETSEDLDATGDEGNLLVDGTKEFRESETQDSVSIYIRACSLPDHWLGVDNTAHITDTNYGILLPQYIDYSNYIHLISHLRVQ